MANSGTDATMGADDIDPVKITIVLTVGIFVISSAFSTVHAEPLSRKELRIQLRAPELSSEEKKAIRTELREIQKNVRKPAKKRRLKPVTLQSFEDQEVQNPQVFESKASYYADKFHGRKTASGEIFSNDLLTAAHRTLPFGTKVLVTSIQHGTSVEVIINDRGPYVEGRIIDLSKAAFSKLDRLSRGVIDVRMEILDN